MKILQPVTILLALSLSCLVGCSDQESSAAEEAVTSKFAYVANMTGIT